MSIERVAVTGLKWTGAAKLAGQVAAWLITLFVLRLLVPQDYGLMAISSVVIAVSATVAELGLGTSIVQSPALAKRELEQVAGLAIVLNLSIGSIVMLLATWASSLFHEQRLTGVIQLSALQFLFAALSTVPEAIAYRDMRFKWLAWLDLGSGLLAGLTTLGLAVAGAGVWSLVIGGLAGSGMRTGLLVGDTFIRPTFRLGGVRRHAVFGGSIAISRLAWQLVNRADVLIAGRYLAPELVGLYSVSLHLATLPMQKIMSIVNQVSLPTIARLQGDPTRLRERLLFALRLLNFVILPLTWGVSAVAPEFIALVLGPKWTAAVFPLQIASLIVPLSMTSSIVSTATVGLGAAVLNLRNTLINAVILPAAFLVGVRWGIVGLAASGFVGMLVILALTLPRMCKVVGLDVRDLVRAGFAPMIAGAAMYGAVTLGRAAWPDMPLAPRLLGLILTGSIVYLAIITLVERTIWRDVRRMVAALRA